MACQSSRRIHGMCVGILILLISEGRAVYLSTHPCQIIFEGDYPTNKLTLSCIDSATKLNTLEIGKMVNGSKSPIVEIAAGKANVSVLDPSLQHRMTYDGHNDEYHGRLEIVLGQLLCSDAATYYCVASQTGDNVSSSMTTDVTASPNIEMIVTPDKYSYLDGTEVALTCTGRIDQNMGHAWVWEWQYSGFRNQWFPYPYTNNIDHSTPVADSHCQYRWSTTLIHTISSEFGGINLRCFVNSSLNDGYANKFLYYYSYSCWYHNQWRWPYVLIFAAIGAAVMLPVGGFCLLIVICNRRRLAKCLSGGKNKYKRGTMSSHQRGIQRGTDNEPTRTEEDHYDMPVNNYDRLRGRTVEPQAVYEELEPYRNRY